MTVDPTFMICLAAYPIAHLLVVRFLYWMAR